VRFGPRTTILNDKACVMSALRRSRDFAIQENFLQRRLSVAEQDEVRDLRAVLSPELRPAALGRVGSLVDRHLNPALDRLEDEWFDPLPIMESVISTAVTELYFGPDGGRLPEMLADLLDELSRVIGNPFALPERWASPVRRRIAAQHELVRNQVTRLLAARLEAPPGAFDDLAAGLVARAGTQHPLPRVADMVIGSLLASQRVPAAAASWLLMALADHHQLQDDIATETSTLQAARRSTPRNNPLVAERVVLEVLRLFPPTWLLVRTATRQVEVAGYSFAAGHHFMISPYVQHRDPDAFPDPTAFRPERWLGPRHDAGHYLPFGGGVHVCPGRHLATSILVAIAQGLTARFRVVRAPTIVTPNPRTTLLPHGLRTALRPVPGEWRAADQLPDLAAESSLR
jgi:cytochrome P450